MTNEARVFRLRALEAYGTQITPDTVWPFTAELTVDGLHAAVHETLRTMDPRATYRRRLPGYNEEQWVRLPLVVEVQDSDGTWKPIGTIPTVRWPVGSPAPHSPGRNRVRRWLTWLDYQARLDRMAHTRYSYKFLELEEEEASTMIPWQSLELWSQPSGLSAPEYRDGPEAIPQLREFRQTGEIYDWFFRRLDLPHEDPEDPSTWGPLSPESVDWSGFPPETPPA
jgi:hypothetical protein